LEEIVGQDIQNIVNSKIDAFIGSVGNVPPEKIAFSAEMFASLGNQPEQRRGNKLRAGNSCVHTTWCVAGNHVKLRRVLPACKECLDWMEYANIGGGDDWQGTSKECAICTNGMIGGMDSPLLAFSPSATFPKVYISYSWTMEQFKWCKSLPHRRYALKRAAMVTQRKLLSGEWSPIAVKSHLKENGINQGYMNLIVQQGGKRPTFDLTKERPNMVVLE
jgi:hypothetical protein